MKRINIIKVAIFIIIAIISGISIGVGIGRATKKAITKRVELIDLRDSFTFESEILKYDSSEQYIEVKGDIPSDVTVVYTNNGKIDIGTYEVIASFEGNTNKYILPNDMKANLTIIPGNMELVYEDESYSYTGEDISHVINNLNSRFEAQYFNNVHKMPGTYEAIVMLRDKLGSYNDIVLSSTMKIKNPNDYGVSLDDLTVVYDGLEHTLTAVGDVDECTIVYKNNMQTNAGVYEVEASLTDPSGIKEPVTLTATLTIKKAEIEGVVFKDTTKLYTGEDITFEATNIPEGMDVKYDNNVQKKLGKYDVTCTITDPNGNYNTKSMKAVLTITDELVLEMDDVYALTDGLEHMCEVSGIMPDGVLVKYYNDDTGEEIMPLHTIGTYNIRAEVKDTQGRYKDVTLKAVLIIKKGYEIVFRVDGMVYESYYIEEHKAVTDFPTLADSVGIEYSWQLETGNDKDVTKALVYNVKRTSKEYNISYNTDYDNPNPSVYTFNADSSMRLDPLEVPGYVFIGWYEEEELINLVDEIKAGRTGDVTLYPCLIPQTYELSYYIGENLYRSVEVAYGMPVKLLKATSGQFTSIMWESKSNDVIYNVSAVIDYNYTSNLRLDAIMVDPNYGFAVKESGGKITLVEYNGGGISGDENIFIPQYYMYGDAYLPVTAIGDECFKNFTYKGNIQKIIVPSGITKIGESAFEGLSNLVTIELSESVVMIGARAFYGCTKLNNISMPAVETVGNSAFQGCASLELVEGESIVTIADNAFANSGIKTIYLEAIASIGENALDVANKVSIYYYGTLEEFEAVEPKNLPEGYDLYIYVAGAFVKA